MPSATHKSITYRPEIDGLRTLAVIPVVLFHAGLGFPGGFVGVDIFFVISGFLITSIIAKDIRNGCFSMPQFWERRIRRILPASVAVLICTMVAGAIILLPNQFEDLGKAASAQSLMVSNFYFWQQDGYFAQASDLEPNLHTWSLAVEEQFYLILPLLMVFILRKKPAKLSRAIMILSVLCVLSLAWSCYGVKYHVMATFYLLPARAWELLAGSLLAIIPLRNLPARFTNECLSLLGSALIFYAFFYYDDGTPFPGPAAIPPCLGAVLFIFSNHGHRTLVGKLLALKPCVFIGKISYSLYLWHWPLLVYARHLSTGETLTLPVRVTLVVVSLILAWGTWKWIENPFRKQSLLKNRKQVFRFCAAAITLLVLVSAGIYQSKGMPARLSPEALAYAESATEKFPIKPTKAILRTGQVPTVVRISDDRPVLPVLAWGDSHCRALAPLFLELCQKYHTNFHIAAYDGRPAIMDVNINAENHSVADYNEAVFNFIQKNQIKHVFLITRWASYVETPHFRSPMRARDDQGDTPDKVFKTHLPETVRKLNAAGVEVWIMKQVPYQHRNPPAQLMHAAQFGWDIEKLGTTVTDHMQQQRFVNQVIDSTASDQCHILDPLSVFRTDQNICRIAKDGRSLYRDNDHVSKYGCQLLLPMFEPIFKSLVEKHTP